VIEKMPHFMKERQAGMQRKDRHIDFHRPARAFQAVIGAILSSTAREDYRNLVACGNAVNSIRNSNDVNKLTPEGRFFDLQNIGKRHFK